MSCVLSLVRMIMWLEKFYGDCDNTGLLGVVEGVVVGGGYFSVLWNGVDFW